MQLAVLIVLSVAGIVSGIRATRRGVTLFRIL